MHPILTDPEMSVPVVLIHCDGERTETRGQVTYAPARRVAGTSGDLAATISKLTVSAPTPENASKVAEIELPGGDVRSVIAADRTASGLVVFAEWDSTRYACR